MVALILGGRDLVRWHIARGIRCSPPLHGGRLPEPRRCTLEEVRQHQ